MTGILEALRPLSVPIASLTLDPKNARTHSTRNVETVRRSLERFGMRSPIVVQRRGAELIVRAGNARVAAAKLLGWTDVAAVIVEEGDLDAAAFGLMDNQSAALADWDEDVLSELLAVLDAAPDFDATLTGFTAQEIERLVGAAAALPDADEIPETPATPVTKHGDIWLLGEHRLLCGDATDAAAVARLMDGGRAAAMWCDPPYGVKYIGKTKDALTITNDGAEGLPALLRGAFSVADAVLEPGAPFYVAHPAGALAVEFELAVRDAGWRHHQTIVWVKDSMVLGHSDYHFRHEPILYGWTKGPGRSGRGGQDGSRWYGDDAQTSVIEVPRPKRSESHPTMKPVELVARCLANSTKKSDVVYEPFSGSGSTLIACEQLGRVCRAVEIDPRYADVIVARFEAVSGAKAIRAYE